MTLNLTKTLVAAAALSPPYVCSAATDRYAQDPQAVDDCQAALTAPPEAHWARNAPLTATPMFDITGDQRLDLFVTVRDPDGNILRQTVCSYDMNRELVGSHRPWPDEMTQWVWE